jgi:hypothetical protein
MDYSFFVLRYLLAVVQPEGSINVKKYFFVKKNRVL